VLAGENALRGDQMTQRRWVIGGLAAAATACLARPLAAQVALAAKAERILVLKRQRRMQLLRGEEVLHEFRVALGREPRGTKLHQGDGRTPEGRYRIDALKPDSYFYRALRVSYPNEADLARARRLGMRPGGNIMIHGLDPNIAAKWHEDHWLFNWTNGCIAVTNREMDIVWASVALGTPVEIRP
jgi:murein L,D-transpeptidase YafK